VSRKHKILFITQVISPSFSQDLKILEKHFDVTVYDFEVKKNAGKELVKWMLKNGSKYNLVYCWFGDVFATIAVLTSKFLRKKSMIMAGGYDTTFIPEINYGFLSSGRNRLYAKIHFGLADKVIPVDESLRAALMENLSLRGNNMVAVHTVYDSKFWQPEGKKEDVVVTTLGVNRERILRKGIDTYVSCAKRLPDVRFVVVGKISPDAKEFIKKAPRNVVFTDYIPEEELLNYYRRAKVYCQLSLYEGIPNALCEAMLCECVPVGTRVCGIPTAIGDAGYYVPYGDVEATTEAIKKALADGGKGKLARERIRNMFPLEKREKQLVEIINNLIVK